MVSVWRTYLHTPCLSQQARQDRSEGIPDKAGIMLYGWELKSFVGRGLPAAAANLEPADLMSPNWFLPVK